MDAFKLDLAKIYTFVSEEEILVHKAAAEKANGSLHRKDGKGNDFLGWVDLPSSMDEIVLSDIEQLAKRIKEEVEFVVTIGIGGSYLGAKAVLEGLSDNFMAYKGNPSWPQIIFAGQNIGEDYLKELIELLDKKSYAIVVISKSGTTTEPAIAFRILKKHLETKVGPEKARNLIVAVTDRSKGSLRKLAVNEGYKTYVIPDDVGGRFSVLTPVGLVPLALGGVDIRKLVKGAVDMEHMCSDKVSYEENPALQYAAARYSLYKKGKKIEILANFNNKLHFLAEWWKQLYGESEGKQNLGIFPASVDLTTDLHSMGQYIQEGERILFETVISVSASKEELTIPAEEDDLDGLNYLTGRNIDSVNKMAELGTILAHVDGGVPNIRIQISELSGYSFGQLIYFFEKACGVSGYLLGINPFDQPGVEAYKKNMFALLEKPGYSEETLKIKSRLI